jgi:hypothetical protein
MPSPPHSPSSVYPRGTWWRVQIMMLHNMQFSPLSSSFHLGQIPSSTTYSREPSICVLSTR